MQNRPPISPGDVIEVYWEGEKEWYKGVVSQLSRGGAAGTVEYDDGDVEEVRRRTFGLVPHDKNPLLVVAPTGRIRHQQVAILACESMAKTHEGCQVGSSE